MLIMVSMLEYGESSTQTRVLELYYIFIGCVCSSLTTLLSVLFTHSNLSGEAMIRKSVGRCASRRQHSTSGAVVLCKPYFQYFYTFSTICGSLLLLISLSLLIRGPFYNWLQIKLFLFTLSNLQGPHNS